MVAKAPRGIFPPSAGRDESAAEETTFLFTSPVCAPPWITSEANSVATPPSLGVNLASPFAPSFAVNSSPSCAKPFVRVFVARVLPNLVPGDTSVSSTFPATNPAYPPAVFGASVAYRPIPVVPSADAPACLTPVTLERISAPACPLLKNTFPASLRNWPPGADSSIGV